MISISNLFSVNQALVISRYSDYIIPYSFTTNQRNLIVTIHNSDNLSQSLQGIITPFSEYGLSGKLEYFSKNIYLGNTLLQINPIDAFKLKFSVSRNGNYFISVDEIISNTESLISLTKQDLTILQNNIISNLETYINSSQSSQNITLENYLLNTIQTNIQNYILANSNQTSIINSLQANSTTAINPVTVTQNITTILNANPNRLGLLLRNTGNQTCYLKLGSVVSTTDYDYTLAGGAVKELSLPYTGILSAICAVNRSTILSGIEFVSN